MTGSTAFDQYLSGDESRVAVGSGTLLETADRTPASICVTDRRVLFVSEDGGFVDVPRDHVQSIHSHPSSRSTTGEIWGRTVLAIGVLVAAIAAVGLFVTVGGPVAAVPAALAVVGLGGAMAIQRSGWQGSAEDVTAVVGWIDRALGRAGVEDAVTTHRRAEKRLGRIADDQPLGFAASALLTIVGLVGLLVLAGTMALALTVGILAGLVLVDYGVRYVRALDRRGERRRRERSVRLHLVDGRTVRFRIDEAETIDRELSRLTADERPAPTVDVDEASPPSVTERASRRS